MNEKILTLGTLVRTLREKKAYSQDDLAWKSNSSRTFLQHVERGRKRDLRLSTIEKLCAGLGLSVCEFLHIYYCSNEPGNTNKPQGGSNTNHV
ncbi:MAG: helix-turn-helix domain-containing protein [Spirochaetes bacterium]|nr:helix-turn-helix domain-containing protein [Spirochaetota bacterium]